MVKAVLFDLDGTLLDTLPDIKKTINETLRKFSYPEITLEQTKRYVGDGAYQLVERAMPADAPNKEACFEYFKETYAKSDNSETLLFEGEMQTLAYLAAAGVKLGVVTNKPQGATVAVCKQFFSEIPFSFIAGDSGDFPCKPDPTLALYAALRMQVAPADCVFVGDGETDAQTAIRAGMYGVSCLWGYRTEEQLRAAGATRFVHSFAELKNLLGKL